MLPESETLTQKFLKRGGYLYVFSYLIAPAGYLINVILANDLTVSEFGILSTLLSLVMMLSIYADAGLYEWLQHFFPQYLARWELQKAKALFLGVLICRLVGGATLTILLYTLAPWIAEMYSFPESVNIVRIYALFFFCIAFFEIATGFLMAIQDTLTYKLLDMSRFYATLVLTLVVWSMGLGNIENYALIWLAGVALVAALSVMVIGVKFHRSFTAIETDWHLPWRQIFGYSLIILASNNISTILHQSDIQLLAYFAGPEEAGYYGVYLKLIGIPFILLAPVISFITPVVSEMYGRWDRQKIALIRSFFRQYLVIGSLIFSGWLFAVAPQLAASLMSEKFRLSGDILRYSLPFVPLLFALQIDFAILSGLGRARERIRAIIIGTLANLILVFGALHLFPALGMRPSGGVALAVGVSWLVLVYATNRLLHEYRGHLDLKKLFLSILMTVSLTAWLFALMPILLWSSWTRPEQILALAVLWFLYILPFGALFWRDLRALRSQLTQLKTHPHDHTT